MKLQKWFKFIKLHLWEIAVFCALLFLIFLCVFSNHIKAYLKGKEDFYLPPIYKKRKQITKKHETKCRSIFEKIFKKPFPSARPSFLRQKNGFCLELDGWNSDLRLAFEFNGVQHSKFSRFFHKSYNDFQAQVKRDIDKKHMCQEAGITLITIPYNIKYDDLEKFIIKELHRVNFVI